MSMAIHRIMTTSFKCNMGICYWKYVESFAFHSFMDSLMPVCVQTMNICMYMVWNEMYVFGVPKSFCFFWSVCILWQLCRTSMSYYMSSFLNNEQLYPSRHETNVLLFRKFRFNISTQKLTQEQARSSSLSISPLSIHFCSFSPILMILGWTHWKQTWMKFSNLIEVLTTQDNDFVDMIYIVTTFLDFWGLFVTMLSIFPFIDLAV